MNESTNIFDDWFEDELSVRVVKERRERERERAAYHPVVDILLRSFSLLFDLCLPCFDATIIGQKRNLLPCLSLPQHQSHLFATVIIGL